MKAEPENYLTTNILRNEALTPMIPFEHKTIDYISLESLVNEGKKLHSFEFLDKKFPTLFKDWLQS